LVHDAVSLTDLQDAVLAVDGIAAAEVEPGTDRGPTVRVWLDGTRTPDFVSADVQRVLEQAGLHAAPPTGTRSRPQDPFAGSGPIEVPGGEPPDANGGARRSGLGRGLEALIPGPDPDLASINRLESIGVEESAIGTVVRAADGAGRFAVAPVDPGRSLNQAVATAVAELSGVTGVPVVLAVEVRRLAGSPVLITVVEHDGRWASGAALVDSGMSYALGRAIWAALRSLA
jgi:hypothetical protein